MKNRHRTYAATFQGMLNNHVGLALNGYTTLSEPVLHTAVRHYMHGIFS
jgi:TetR/AcrR family transcriptional regulator